MPITLTPEQEATVITDARESGYETPEAYLAERLESIHLQDEFITANREEFAKLIDEGIDDIERGHVYSAEEVKAHLQKAKQDFLAAKRSAA